MFAQLRRGRPSVPAGLGRERALRLTEQAGALAHLIAGLERVATDQGRPAGGTGDGQPVRSGERLRFRLRCAGGRAANGRMTRTLHLTQVAAAVVLLLPTRPRLRLGADTLLTVLSVGLHPRHRAGSDGAYTASFVVQAAAAVARLGGAGRPAVADACLWFVASQSALAYAASGYAKLSGEAWRQGRAVTAVVRTHTFGDPAAYALARRHPGLARLATYAVIGVECSFPLVFAVSSRLTRVLVGSVAALHVANARVMGLNRFLPAFGSMYPAVMYTTGPRRRVVEGRIEARHDAYPIALGAGVAVLLGGWF